MKKLINILFITTFFILLYFIYFFKYQPSLFYHYHQPMFLFSGTFLKDFLHYPGGILDWANQFIFQFFIWNWAGALILTVLTVSIFLIIYHVIKSTGLNHNPYLISFIPLGFLLFCLTQYNAPLVISLRFLTAILFFTIYSHSGKFKWIFILLSWPIYLVLGGWNFIFYCILIVMLDLLQSKNKMLYIYAGVHVLMGGLYPIIAAKYIYLITLKEAYKYLYPIEFHSEPYRFSSGLVINALYIVFPVILFLALIYTQFIRNRIRKSLRFSRFGQSDLAQFISNLIQFMLIFILTGCILFISHDSELKTKIAIDRFAERGDWEQVLKYTGRIHGYDRLINFQVNRALYFKGQLLNTMFSYPQILGSDGLFIHSIIASQIAIPASDLLFDLAHINGAQTMAYEGQTKLQYNPRILKRLVMTNMINGDNEAAEKFVDILKQSLIHRQWALKAEQLLSDRFKADANAVISRKRALKPDKDFFFNNKNPYIDLEKLVDQHPENRMAFEYLIAYYLLDIKLKNIFMRLDQFPVYGYKTLPRHVEEAILLLDVMYPKTVNLDQIPIHPETYRRYSMFNKILSDMKNDPNNAKKALKKDFRDTYWYYVRYTNPFQTNIKLKAKRIDEGY